MEFRWNFFPFELQNLSQSWHLFPWNSDNTSFTDIPGNFGAFHVQNFKFLGFSKVDGSVIRFY
jgi:hypothetical protein